MVTKDLPRSAFFLSLLLVFSVLLAACGTNSLLASNPTATATLAPTPTTTPVPTPTHTPTPIPTDTPEPQHTPQPQPKPISPQGWATHTSTAHHYTIRYPANWRAESDFYVWNFNVSPQQQAQMYSLKPPLMKIEVLAMDNPTQLSPLEFYKKDLEEVRQQYPGLVCPDPGIHPATVGGHEALQAVCPSRNSIGYWVGNGTKMFYIYQTNAVNGQPSPIFVQMVESFTFTS